jgi:NAD(P)-dependent dehydrogenase (short-subunit alcohol dehydrogenase family)
MEVSDCLRLVTGGALGIGAAIAADLRARGGASVVTPIVRTQRSPPI